ncbi:hypothetical protein PIROE2DRAFT_61368 [Piromyces sp. E2]|nr:hypothetical protein PIROE2DRAFT_61368 [Piromyces sp. E2]|eukprot:OUM63295.1 hypothetical protein PIROE2DRAFT_61368 [Piromyces sp. E2]
MVSQQLNGKNSKYDFYMIDSVWTGRYGEHLIDLQGKPFYSDYGVLLYRKDLLEKYNQPVPETWDQLEYIAEYILEKEGGELEGFAGQFKAEALIYEESTSLEKWQRGNVLFMRNWPNAIQSTEEMFNLTGVKFPFGMARLPGRKVGLSAATLGGWNLGVSKYSNNPLLAAKIVEFLTGEYSQKQRALKFSLLPSIKYLYSDKDVCNVIMCDVYKNIQAINRPSNEENYLDLSQVIYETIHKALENTISAEEAIKTIKKYTNSILSI